MNGNKNLVTQHNVLIRDDRGNGIPIPMGMGIDDTIGNGNGKEWESLCMGMEMEINSHRRMQCLAYIIVTNSLLYNGNSL